MILLHPYSLCSKYVEPHVDSINLLVCHKQETRDTLRIEILQIHALPFLQAVVSISTYQISKLKVEPFLSSICLSLNIVYQTTKTLKLRERYRMEAVRRFGVIIAPFCILVRQINPVVARSLVLLCKKMYKRMELRLR